MVPVSTALYDPKWFKKKIVEFDSNNVLIGVNDRRLNPDPHDNYCENCSIKDPSGPCQFIKSYKDKLSKIDPKKFLATYESLEKSIIQLYKAKKIELLDGVQFVFMVHEAPWKECSERKSLQEFLAQFNLGNKELDPSDLEN